jgi:Abortive infection alpha
VTDIDEFAIEIAKQLPIKEAYKDAIQPAAKQTGELGEELVKALRLALFPIQLAAGLQDRFRRFVRDSVARVPLERQVSPVPQIAGPVLEGVRYEPEGTTIDKMFSELLSTAMDSSRLRDVHPAFPLIIRQLSADEAKILELIASSKDHPRRVQIFRLRDDGLVVTDDESNDLSAAQMHFPENVSMYTNRLDKLGLISFDVEKPMERINDEAGRQTGGRNFFVCKLTEFGASFMRACSGNTTIQG